MPIEEARRANTLGSSLQAAVTLPLSVEERALLTEDQWAEIAIVSKVRIVPEADASLATIDPAPGSKCARCWRVLTEVGQHPTHPTLCCAAPMRSKSGLVCRA